MKVLEFCEKVKREMIRINFLYLFRLKINDLIDREIILENYLISVEILGAQNFGCQTYLKYNI